MSKVKYLYQTEISQMMFVFGEVSDPLDSTTQLVEEITREQLIEILIQVVQITAMKGSRNILPEDLMFLMRHDKSKVNRMRTFLSWKDVRKNVKDDRGTGTAEAEELIDETGDKMVKIRKLNVKLPWDIIGHYSSVLVTEDDDDDINDDDRDAYEDQIQRLKVADDLTKSMTKEEYVYYSDCRQSSFTFKKAKKFKDWLNVSHVVDSKISSDVIDILGFLAYEIVSKLTEYALQVKMINHNSKLTAHPQPDAESITTQTSLFSGDKKCASIFDHGSTEQAPLEPKHIQEGFRRLQKSKFPLLNLSAKSSRQKLVFI